MERSDRQRIDDCCDELVESVHIPALLPLLFKYKVLSRSDGNIGRWMVRKFSNFLYTCLLFFLERFKK